MLAIRDSRVCGAWIEGAGVYLNLKLGQAPQDPSQQHQLLAIRG